VFHSLRFLLHDQHNCSRVTTETDRQGAKLAEAPGARVRKRGRIVISAAGITCRLTAQRYTRAEVESERCSLVIVLQASVKTPSAMPAEWWVTAGLSFNLAWSLWSVVTSLSFSPRVFIGVCRHVYRHVVIIQSHVLVEVWWSRLYWGLELRHYYSTSRLDFYFYFFYFFASLPFKLTLLFQSCLWSCLYWSL